MFFTHTKKNFFTHIFFPLKYVFNKKESKERKVGKERNVGKVGNVAKNRNNKKKSK